MNEKKIPLWAACIIGLAIILVSLIMSSTWRSVTRANQTITVTGSAKKEITSDLGILRGTINCEAPTAEAAYKQLKSQMPKLIAYLENKGFPKEQINLFTINSYAEYEKNDKGMQTGKLLKYVYSQRIEVKSDDVNKIKTISLDISSIVESGIMFMVEPPEYYYTKIADLKISIQAEAAKDAMERAERIAASTKRSLGVLRNARMGVIQITPRFSNTISDYGVNDVSSIDKEITSVVNASFEIE
jgi:hypothetical protein